MKITKIKSGKFIYHGTINNFNPNDLNYPAWFSFDIDQAHNHIAYRYHKDTNGSILKYKIIYI